MKCYVRWSLGALQVLDPTTDSISETHAVVLLFRLFLSLNLIFFFLTYPWQPSPCLQSLRSLYHLRIKPFSLQPIRCQLLKQYVISNFLSWPLQVLHLEKSFYNWSSLNWPSFSWRTFSLPPSLSPLPFFLPPFFPPSLSLPSFFLFLLNWRGNASMQSPLSVLLGQSCLTLQHHGLSPVRLLCPWDSPDRNTGVGCHFLLRGSSQPKNRMCTPCVSCLDSQILYLCATRKPIHIYTGT